MFIHVDEVCKWGHSCRCGNIVVLFLREYEDDYEGELSISIFIPKYFNI